MENNTTFSQLEHFTLNGRNTWLYEINTPIGDFYVVDSENKYAEIVRTVVFSKQDAEKRFEKICTKMLKGIL